MDIVHWLSRVWQALNSASPLANFLQISATTFAACATLYGFFYRRLKHSAGQIADLGRDLASRTIELDRIRLELDASTKRSKELEDRLAGSALSRAEREWRDLNDERGQRELAEWIEREGKPISELIVRHAEWYAQMSVGEFRAAGLSAAEGMANAALVLHLHNKAARDLANESFAYLELEGQERFSFSQAIARLQDYSADGRLFAPGDVEEALARESEARKLNARGFYNLALLMVNRAVTILHLQLGAHAAQTIELRSLRAYTLDLLGRYSDALTEIDTTIASQKGSAAFGWDHPEVFDAQYKRAAILFHLERYARASRVVKDLIEMESAHAKYGPDHFATLKAKLLYAYILKSIGQSADALLIATEVAEQLTASPDYGPGHPVTLGAQEWRAEFLCSLERSNEALPIILGVLEKMKAHAAIGAEHPNTLVAQKSLAQILNALGRSAEALAIIDQVVTKMAAHPALGATHPFTLTCAKLRQDISQRLVSDEI